MTEKVTCLKSVKLSSSISNDAVKLMFSTSFKSFALCRNMVNLHKSCRFSTSSDVDTLINSSTLPSIGNLVNPVYIKTQKRINCQTANVNNCPNLTFWPKLLILPKIRCCILFSFFLNIYIPTYQKTNGSCRNNNFTLINTLYFSNSNLLLLVCSFTYI